MKARVWNSETQESKWMRLPAPLWQGSEVLSTGLSLIGLYRGAKSGRTVVATYSYWVNQRTNQVEGVSFVECSPESWLMYCDVAGIDPQTEAEEL
jgi:hypothetical protein